MFKQRVNSMIWTWLLSDLTTASNSYVHRYLCKNSGLSILLHGVISLPDATSYDKYFYEQWYNSVIMDLWVVSMSHDMRFPMWYMRPAKPQISLRIRAVWSEHLLVLEYSVTVKLLTEHHLECLSLKGGCTDLSESTLVKMPHCWKLHVAAQYHLAS